MKEDNKAAPKNDFKDRGRRGKIKHHDFTLTLNNIKFAPRARRVTLNRQQPITLFVRFKYFLFQSTKI